MNNELVSVIMSCYNENPEWVENSIQSIIKQTYKNIEFIIVNDNPDNIELYSMLNKYDKLYDNITVIYNEKNIGLVSSLNKAISKCKGIYIARMDSDDISNLTRIEKQVKYMHKNKNIDLVMCHSNLIDERGKKIGENRITPSKKYIAKLLKYKNVSIHPTWLFRREIIDKLNGYRECKYIEDYDLLCRAIINGYNLGSINECLLDYRIRSSSICNSNRLEQQINFQLVQSQFLTSIKRGKSYMDISIDEVTENEINLYYKRMGIYKKFVEDGDKLKGYILIIYNMIKNKYKRRQLINEIKYKFWSLYINNRDEFETY